MMRFAAAALLLSTANATIALPSIYGSHMVLQADQPGELWGTAAAGAAVTVHIAAAKTPPGFWLNTTADAASGRFSVALPPTAPSMTPFDIAISSGADRALLSDVLFGAVYVCRQVHALMGLCRDYLVMRGYARYI